MTAQTFTFVFFALCAAGVLLSLIITATQRGRIFAWLGCAAAISLLGAGGRALFAGDTFTTTVWSLPSLGTITLRLDLLSAVFALVTGLVLFPASIFAASKASDRTGRSFYVLMFALYASIVLILIAGDALLFLLAWELMSIFCYLLIVQGGERENDQAPAGYLLLSLGEAGTIAAALAFLFLAINAHSLDFATIKTAGSALSGPTRWIVFLFSFFGFGVKAGLVPVNLWLPRAYSAASRGFVPVLAGATLNLGLYGIFRVNADLMPAQQIGPGLVALIVGTISALFGILYANTNSDLKVMLAHSSIENAGLVVAGFGAGMVFIAAHHPALASIAFVAGMYHLINHSLYKTLLFIGAGTVEASTGTRDMDRLGGLIKWMPLTGAAFLAGTWSIAALPPFNGFTSEWLILQAMLRSSELSSTGAKLVFALCGAGLALTAALAVTCFVKVFAMSFLGMRRLDKEQHVSEATSGALGPMAILAALCLAFGVLPTYVIPALDTALSPIVGHSAADELVPPFFVTNPAHSTLPSAFAQEFHDLGAQTGQSILPGRGLVVMHRGGKDNPVVFAMSTSYMLVALIVLLLLTYVIVRLWLTRSRTLARRERWDGGLRHLLPEMTYTATGFSNPVRVVFDAVFRPTRVEDTRETIARHFRGAIRRKRVDVNMVDRLVMRPAKDWAMKLANALARMHHGRINTYSAYVLLALLAALIVGFLLQG
jgi:hydrogenase-4 component B